MKVTHNPEPIRHGIRLFPREVPTVVVTAGQVLAHLHDALILAQGVGAVGVAEVVEHEQGGLVDAGDEPADDDDNRELFLVGAEGADGLD